MKTKKPKVEKSRSRIEHQVRERGCREWSFWAEAVGSLLHERTRRAMWSAQQPSRQFRIVRVTEIREVVE